MDIISEIIDIDNSAQKQLDDAQAKSIEMLKAAEDNGNEQMKSAHEKIIDYKASKDKEVQDIIDLNIAKINEEEQAKAKAIADFFKNNSDKWINEIFSEITQN